MDGNGARGFDGGSVYGALSCTKNIFVIFEGLRRLAGKERCVAVAHKADERRVAVVVWFLIRRDIRLAPAVLLYGANRVIGVAGVVYLDVREGVDRLALLASALNEVLLRGKIVGDLVHRLVATGFRLQSVLARARLRFLAGAAGFFDDLLTDAGVMHQAHDNNEQYHHYGE